ncbi:MAG: hypothetical protein IKR23_14300 [Lachnospiraceae bacterium]|nr:hypothetical protein [Lachnospiraceae bacterium]
MNAKRIREYILMGKGASFKNEYAARDLPSYPLYLMAMIYVRVILTLKTGADMTDVIAETIYAAIYLIIWISQLIHPFRMARMYYLCPKDKAERETDIREAYIFRSILYSIMIAFMCADIYLLQKANIWSVIYMFISGVMFSFLSQIKTHKYLLNLYVIPALSMAPYFQFALTSTTLEKSDIIFLMISYAFLLICVVPAYVKIMKAIGKEIKEAAECEEVTA